MYIERNWINNQFYFFITLFILLEWFKYGFRSTR